MRKITECVMGFAIGAGLTASFLFFGLRAKAAPVDLNDLRSIPRSEITDMVSREEWFAPYTQSELDLMAAIIYAEAGDQDFEGMRLVGDVIMNRVNSPDPYWPDTVAEVVYQPYQFSPVLDGGLDRAWANVTPECYEAARLALSGDHINTDVIFFSMYGCANGTFVFQHGCHYFGV